MDRDPLMVLPILTVEQIGSAPLADLLARFGAKLVMVGAAAEIPGSYWGESEAGLVIDQVYARLDTPVHSVLHEASHFVCMDAARRAGLNRDAGGDFDEENAVCYLQVLLADELPGMLRSRMWADMDAWGYTFRLGSARAWFEQDAGDACAWLIERRILDAQQRPTWRVRDDIRPILMA